MPPRLPTVRGRLAAVVAAWLLVAGGCALPRWRPPYGAERTPVRDLAAYGQRLADADAASPRIFVGEIGRSAVTGGAVELPLWRVAFRPFEAELPRVLLVAGVRGDEPAGPQAALELVQAWSRTPQTGPRADIDVVPIVNPWGWVHDDPLTGRGIDLDRDFTDFDAAESRILRRFLREKRYDLVIELREERQAAGATLRQYGGADTDAARRAAEAIAAAGHLLAEKEGGVAGGPRAGVAAVPMWQLRALSLVRRLDLPGYLRRGAGTAVFSARAPSSLEAGERAALLRRAAEELIAQFAPRR